MIYIFLSIIILCFCQTAEAQVITINKHENTAPGSWICFRNSITLKSKPETIKLSIAADTKYWLWINGEIQIREGGLKRGPNPKDTYQDIITDLPALKKGKNIISILVWYFGKQGFSHRNSGTPGITFNMEVDGNHIIPDNKWKTIYHPAFYIPDGEQPNFRLAESNIGFDSGKDIEFTSPNYNDRYWEDAVTVSLQEAGWNNLVDRPIPFWKDYGLKNYTKTYYNGNTILIAQLPYNAQITPYIKIKAPKGQKIKIMTDNYRGGSEPNVFAEYTTSEGIQEFECYGWMNGHTVLYTIPENTEVIEVKYRETGYDTSFAGSFRCDDEVLNTLWNKAQRTLYITMRDTYMDCPDRERAQWWGDVVNELGEAFYALDEKAHLLTRKGIHELMDWQRADSTIYSPVPSGNYESELPMQMLASIGQYGFWTYYMGSADTTTISYVFPKVKKYIHLWKTNQEGLVIPRKGGWTWGDWGENKDMELLFNQWYIIALQGYEKMANLVGQTNEAEWALKTAEKAKKVFHKKYWNGEFYISPNYNGLPDDRSQTLAIISGTLSKQYYPTIRKFFSEYYHASPYMEKYVLQALCMMGYHQDTIDRMKFRYSEMIESNLTTLWEGWGIGNKGFGGGTYNHAWSGGPLTIMSQYIAGIETTGPAFSTFKICPNPASLKYIKAIVPLKGNRKIKLELNRNSNLCKITVHIPQYTTATFCKPDDYEKMKINGVIYHNKQELTPGKWEIELYNTIK